MEPLEYAELIGHKNQLAIAYTALEQLRDPRKRLVSTSKAAEVEEMQKIANRAIEEMKALVPPARDITIEETGAKVYHEGAVPMARPEVPASGFAPLPNTLVVEASADAKAGVTVVRDSSGGAHAS